MLTLPAATLPLRARRWRVLEALSGLLRRFFGLCLAAIVLAATLGGGRAYVWCSMMQQRVETCCCDPAPRAQEERGETGQELRGGCCESRHAATFGMSTTSPQALEVPAALPAACVPRTEPVLAVPKWSSLRVPAASVGLRERTIRAGPYGASDVCIRLQVFRC
jgi:hypothetical protein